MIMDNAPILVGVVSFLKIPDISLVSIWRPILI